MQYIFYLLGLVFALISIDSGFIFFITGLSLAMVGLLLDLIKNGFDSADQAEDTW